MALRQPAQLLDGRLAFADAREAEIAAHADPPENGGTHAHAVHRVLRIFEEPGGVQHVRHAGLAAGRVQLIENALKGLGLRDRRLLAAEGGMQMGVDAGHVQTGHVAEDGQQLVELVRQKAVAAHAGVDLDVDLGLYAELLGYAVQNRRVILARDGQNRAEV